MLPQAQAEVYEPPHNCIVLTRYFYPVSERSDRDLWRQLMEAEVVVARAIKRPLQPHQREALLCLVSDLIAGRAVNTFERSFLVTALNKGMLQIAAAEFYVFCYAEGKVQTRVWQKRKAETYLFERGQLLFD